uniref:Uncharacterized protein n=1 Tax=Chromera velia CCMP2878 TaxID=1169474 RepID=A0A0G4HY50_9ALVE|eukprot:Cvel_9403.t1-p1 / transcript=Cvel_9403.t1 / gene=Cvel_9403 / organism=Chromera_velia_CCMP2878 / gene_product=hypothetical protein / transcript_product=hypothetical protein / location=Cvel_scaffold540:61874-62963(-) / protein_length=123 / sequence_SO=supercontig / SO=protein_coding / is_pseudo=false
MPAWTSRTKTERQRWHWPLLTVIAALCRFYNTQKTSKSRNKGWKLRKGILKAQSRTALGYGGAFMREGDKDRGWRRRHRRGGMHWVFLTLPSSAEGIRILDPDRDGMQSQPVQPSPLSLEDLA